MTDLRKRPKVPEGLKAFVHVGLLSAAEAQTATGDNFPLDCPFCEGGQSLGVVLTQRIRDGRSISPGMWNCFKCGESGNTVSLLQKLYTMTKEQPVDLSPLAQERELPVRILSAYGITRSLWTEDWWIPVFNEQGTLINLYKYNISLKQSGSPYAFLGCPGIPSSLFNLQTLQEPPPDCKLKAAALLSKRQDFPVYIAEGHWDTMALDQALREAGQRGQCDLLGVPGANSFQAAWFRLLDRRHLILVFDGDPPRQVQGRTIQPGWDGMQRVVTLARHSLEFKPASIRIMEWKA